MYGGFREENVVPDYTNELTEASTLELGAAGDIVSAVCIFMGVVFILIALKKYSAARRFAAVAAAPDGDGAEPEAI